ALNPIDVKIASGTFYAGPPEVPYAPGREGVGLVREGDRITEGTRVRFELDSGYGTNGSVAEFVTVDEAACVPLSDDVEDDVAAALGIAGIVSWLALEKANVDGATVVVLGATGASGQIAVQGAKLMGAKRVIAAARNVKARAYGELVKHAIGGRLRVALDVFPLDRIADAWGEQAAFPHRKIVIHVTGS